MESCLRKLLECPVCLEVFHHPKLLVCGHTICAGCEHRLMIGAGRRASVVCPVCRKDCRVPKIGQLPTEYRLAEIIDLLCKDAPTSTGQCKCVQCDQFVEFKSMHHLCDSCFSDLKSAQKHGGGEVLQFDGSCWTCGVRGHKAVDCTRVRCTNCGVEGHVLADCAHCWKCGSALHSGSFCSEIDTEVNLDATESLTDDTEDSETHESDNNEIEEGVFDGNCWNCGAYGHRIRQCQEPTELVTGSSETANSSFDGFCWHCHEYGHKLLTCPQRLFDSLQNELEFEESDEEEEAEAPPEPFRGICWRCKQRGHKRTDCPQRI